MGYRGNSVVDCLAEGLRVINACHEASMGGSGPADNVVSCKGDVIVGSREYVNMGIGDFWALPALFVLEGDVLWGVW